MRTRVKMCGTTRLEDALFAVRCGVDALGFILFPKSPRNITAVNAAKICAELPPFIDRVGVFVDEPLENVKKSAMTAGFSYVQLHGQESTDYCYELGSTLPHIQLLKAFRVSGESRSKEFAPYTEYVDGFLLDTYVKGAKGGTGEVFDWSIVSELNLMRPVILAGGLTPLNIGKAIATVKPYGVDINSGVEISPGIKDHGALKNMMVQIASGL